MLCVLVLFLAYSATCVFSVRCCVRAQRQSSRTSAWRKTRIANCDATRGAVTTRLVKYIQQVEGVVETRRWRRRRHSLPWTGDGLLFLKTAGGDELPLVSPAYCIVALSRRRDGEDEPEAREQI